MIRNFDEGFFLKCSQHAPISDFCWVVHTHTSSREGKVPNSNNYTWSVIKTWGGRGRGRREEEGRDGILPSNQVD